MQMCNICGIKERIRRSIECTHTQFRFSSSEFTTNQPTNHRLNSLHHEAFRRLQVQKGGQVFVARTCEQNHLLFSPGCR